MLRFLTAGESHGPAEVAILEGIPAGLSLSGKMIQMELEKRRFGAGRGGRAKIETDVVEILSGVRFGKTLGSPIALIVRNNDFKNWEGKMDVENIEDIKRTAIPVHNPRPGHADLAGVQKYAFTDIRNVLERASARETVMRVAVGAICKTLLSEFGISIASHTVQIGNVFLKEKSYTFQEIENVYVTDPDTRCIDKQTGEEMARRVLDARIKKDTLGGVIEIYAIGVPPGLGSHVHFDRKLDGLLSGALMSIPSVKAVEIGEGIENSGKFGSLVHDEIGFKDDKYVRKTNRAGGIEGGISNGQPIICRVYHKPISTLNQPLETINIATKEKTQALIERSDVCVVPRAGVISESMIAYVLSVALLEKFGSDSVTEVKRNFINYMKTI